MRCPIKNQILHAACALVGVLLLVPAAFAQQQSYLLDVDSSASEVHVDVAITGHLEVSGVNIERVHVEATSHKVGATRDCPISLQQTGDTIAISLSLSDGCQGDLDLRIYIPRRFNATLFAPAVREVVMHKLDGRVMGEVNPDLKCYFRSFRGSSFCDGGHFNVTFSRGEFTLRAQS